MEPLPQVRRADLEVLADDVGFESVQFPEQKGIRQPWRQSPQALGQGHPELTALDV
jgi:hypothetical protein